MGYLIIVTAICSALVYFIAVKRNANRKFWLLMAVLFGPFALPFVFLARRATPEEA